MLNKLIIFFTNIFKQDKFANSFLEEQEFFAQKVTVIGGFIGLFVWLPYIEVDKTLFPDLTLIPWLRVGLSLVSLIGLINYFTKKQNPKAALQSTVFFASYLLCATGLLTGLTGGNAAYMGGYSFVLMCSIVLNIPFHIAMILFYSSILSFGIGLSFSDFDHTNFLFQYSLRDLLTVFSVAQIFAYLYYRSRKKSFSHVQKLNSQNAIIHQKNMNIESSLRYAQKIQKVIIESSQKQKNMPDNFCIYMPKDIVSGDFFKIYYLENQKEWLFIVGDCTGHGVPGAFLTILAINALDKIVIENNVFSPKIILEKLDVILHETLDSDSENVDDGVDIGIFSLNVETKIAHFSGAKTPFCYVSNGKTNYVKGQNFSLGTELRNHRVKNFVEHEIKLAADDMIYLFSDGFEDQLNEERKKFLFTELLKAVAPIAHLELNKQKEILFQKFNAWKGEHTQIDDVTLMGIRV